MQTANWFRYLMVFSFGALSLVAPIAQAETSQGVQGQAAHVGEGCRADREEERLAELPGEGRGEEEDGVHE